MAAGTALGAEGRLSAIVELQSLRPLAAGLCLQRQVYGPNHHARQSTTYGGGVSNQ